MTTPETNVTNTIEQLEKHNKKILTAFIDSYTGGDMSTDLIYSIVDQITVTKLLLSYKKIKESGISSGFFGFSYHSDTVPFYSSNQRNIIDYLHNVNNNCFGYDSIIKVLTNKYDHYLGSLNTDAINEAIYICDKHSDEHALVANMLSWMVAERLCIDLDAFLIENKKEFK